MLTKYICSVCKLGFTIRLKYTEVFHGDESYPCIHCGNPSKKQHTKIEKTPAYEKAKKKDAGK